MKGRAGRRRIVKSRDIGNVLKRGQRSRRTCVDLFAARPSQSEARIGVIVPKYGHTGVERNLLKRRLREIGRKHVLPKCDAVGVSVDLLVRARAEAYGAGYRALREDVLGGADKWLRVCS